VKDALTLRKTTMETQQDNKIFIFFIFVFMIIAISILFPHSDVVKLIKSDGISEIGCGSDSMGLTISCEQNVRYHFVKETERLIPGDIYIYTMEEYNDTDALHRLIGCVKYEDGEIIEGCGLGTSFLIFKGDNNRVMDPPIRYLPTINLKHVDILFND